MFTVTQGSGPASILTLADDGAGSVVEIAPARGGMITRFAALGREVLYLDRRTFDDPAANVRGGVPVLFPSPGKLAGDAWAWGGARGAMKQHGFARNLGWEVTATGTDDGAWATLALRSDERTRAQFPWDFRASFTYRLRGASVRIEMEIENTGAEAMPCGVGFHPYFAVRDAEKGAVRIPTAATRAFDNKGKRMIAFGGFDLTADEVDLHLVDHGATSAEVQIGDGRVTIRGSAEMTHWVVWTQKGKDFVCVEPWSCPGDALNTGDRLLVIAKGARVSPWVELGCG